MTTLLLGHDIFIEHKTPEGHPERPDRLRALNQILASEHFNDLVREEAPKASARAASCSPTLRTMSP